MARTAILLVLLGSGVGTGCTSDSSKNGAPPKVVEVSVPPTTSPEQGVRPTSQPGVWIISTATLKALVQASRDHSLEPELPIKVKGAHVGFRDIKLDTASVLCKSIDRKAGCWVARLELKDGAGSRYWSISTYDTAFVYRGSLVVEQWRASRSPDTVFLAGQVWYYGEGYPLDYQIRTFDPRDSLIGHPDHFDAKKAVGYTICKDGSIRCCPIPKNCFHRKSEMRLIVPDTCMGC